jgi:hypothetical protein
MSSTVVRVALSGRQAAHCVTALRVLRDAYTAQAGDVGEVPAEESRFTADMAGSMARRIHDQLLASDDDEVVVALGGIGAGVLAAALLGLAEAVRLHHTRGAGSDRLQFAAECLALRQELLELVQLQMILTTEPDDA